jgi:hypothetical protein
MSGNISIKLYNFENIVFYVNPRNSNLSEIKNRIAGTLNGSSNVGNSILFNGTTDFITFPFYTGIQTNVVTIDCWIKPTSIGTESVLFSVLDWSNYNAGLPTRGYALFWNNNTFVFSYGPGTQAPNIVRTSSTVSTLNRWCNIVVTNNLGVTTFYLNGSLLSSVGTSGNPVLGVPLDWTYGTGAIPNVSISRKNNSNIAGGFFSGNIGPIKVYNKVLTPSEINTNYNQLKSLFV